MLKSLGIFFLGLLLFIASLLHSYSFFNIVKVKKGFFKDYFIVGVVTNNKPGEIALDIDNIQRLLYREYKYSSITGIGIYTPNNDSCIVGVVVEKEKLDKINDKKLLKLKIDSIGNIDYIEFPLKTKLSIIVGRFKVYSKLKKLFFGKKVRKKIIEIYDQKRKKIFYLVINEKLIKINNLN